jgi:hypothetical protein
MDSRPMELTPGARRILELLHTEQTLTLGQVVRLTGLPESTAKGRIRELPATGSLLRYGQRKGSQTAFGPRAPASSRCGSVPCGADPIARNNPKKT